jgi:DNA topoisomerase-2
MHLYGPSGHIKRYNTVEDIMRAYYQVRYQLYISRKNHQLDIINHQLKLISSKVKFISMVVKKQLKINDVPRLAIEEELVKHKFKQMGVSKDNTKVSYDYLLTMPIYNLTSEKIIELNQQHKDKKEEYEELANKTPEDIWLSELDVLEAEYTKWYDNKIKETKPKSIKKKSKKK